MRVEIPDKLYFKIGEVSEIVGVEPHVLRFWESEFSQIKPNRAASKQRLYRRYDLEIFLEIKQLLYDELYTIAGAKKKLSADRQMKLAMEPTGPEAALRDVRSGLLEIKRLLNKKK